MPYLLEDLGTVRVVQRGDLRGAWEGGVCCIEGIAAKVVRLPLLNLLNTLL